MTLVSAALAYAARGWPVLPLRPREKVPLGRFVPHGHHEATVDPDLIRAWWSTCPDANLGIVTSDRSGLFALDIDPRNGGDDTLDALQARHGELPRTVEALSGGGGRHILFRRPPGVRFKASLGPGVDVKADGYIVAPPSTHASGRPYAWELSNHPDDTEIAELPAWVMAVSMQLGSDHERHEPIGHVATCFLARAFAAAGMLGRQIDKVRICVRCPWEHMHSPGSPASSTVIFAPSKPGALGGFNCLHDNACGAGRRSVQEVLDALPPAAVRQATAETIAQRAAEVDIEADQREAKALKGRGDSYDGGTV